MSHDSRVQAALRLLEALTAAPNHSISRSQACAALGCRDAEVESYCELLSTLADRNAGTRAIVSCDETSVALFGDAGALRPLRLGLGEGLALEHVLSALRIDSALSSRISQALLKQPLDAEATKPLIASTTSYGAWYQRLSEAIEDGVRCTILYRSHRDTAPMKRLIDPGRIDTDATATYLIAWDVEKDAERTYRLDRIASVTLTEDSVSEHGWEGVSRAASLSEHGVRATLECSAERAAQLTWQGIESTSPAPENPERVRLTVYVASDRWLFDEVLAAAGDMVIIEPKSLVENLVSYSCALRQSVR